MAGKTVLITGASAGIGEACARLFASQGANLILWARREDRIRELAVTLAAEHEITVNIAVIDVRDRERVTQEGEAIAAAGNVPHVLINNAGLARGLAKLHEGDPSDWDEMIDTNIKGVLNVARAIIPHMVKLDRGHIINMGSLAAHMTYPNGNVYAATKFFVRALSDGMNLDLAGTSLRVSCIDPGLVETEFSVVRFHGDAQRARQPYRGLHPLTAEDIADTISYVVNTPEHVNILDVVMVPVAQRNIYVIDRKES